MIGLDTERPETIAIGTNEHIGTDPANLLRALARGMTGQWIKPGLFLRCGTAKRRYQPDKPAP